MPGENVAHNERHAFISELQPDQGKCRDVHT
jgi:hypothetical protein